MVSLRTILIATLITTSTLSSKAHAGDKPPLSAKELYEACKYTVEKLDEGPKALTESKKLYQCLYYVMAASDTAQILSTANVNGVYLCVPKDYVFQDVARAIVGRGVTHPLMLNSNVPASSLAYFSLADVYGSNQPCDFDKSNTRNP